MIHIFTITAKNYLSLALALGDSVARLHPEAHFTICVADGLENISPKLFQNHRMLDAREVLPAEKFIDMSFKYDITEFCTSFKPAVFKHIFDHEPDTNIIHYMDPDTYLYSRLDPITEDSPQKTLYLAPHLIECRLADDNPYPEYHHLWEGIFNLGYCAIRRTASTAKLLDWWEARLSEYCFSDYTDGLHTDQKWMDYAPAIFSDELKVIRHYGVNVAHWNLIERKLTQHDGVYFAGTDPLIFFHFSGFDFKGELFNKVVPLEKQQAYSSSLLRKIAAEYRQAVHAQGYAHYIAISYAFNTFDNGTPISKPHRRLYRAISRVSTTPNPFLSDQPFYSALRDGNLLDNSSAAFDNYSKATVSNLSSKLNLVGWVMRLFARFMGFRRYAQLIKLLGYLGRFENHKFLLNKSL